MVECSYCGSMERMPFGCKFCGERFCPEHRLPENHECRGLVAFREEREKTPEKWIYDPFKKEGVKTGRGVKKPLVERLSYFFYKLDSRKILYGILIVIVLLTLSRL